MLSKATDGPLALVLIHNVPANIEAAHTAQKNVFVATAVSSYVPASRINEANYTALQSGPILKCKSNK